MVSVTEAAGAPSSMAGELAEGIQNLSLNTLVSFKRYDRFVLPVDGFVFWLASATPAISVQGSLHYSVQRQQEEDSTVGNNQLVFTTTTEVANFNLVADTIIWVATLPDGTRWSFGGRGRFYAPANLYHYTGASILPPMLSQLVDDVLGFDRTTQVVSNSLPFWLALNSYVPPYDGFQFPAGFTLYPSFILPDNISPPYGVVHVDPASGDGWQGAPYYDASLSPWDLAEEEVRLTIYGLRNPDAQTVRDTIMQYSYDYGYFGVMNTPVLRDEKRTQVELASLGMKKTMTIRINYNQYTARNVARQEIERVVVSYYPQPLTAVGFVPIAP